MQKSKQNEKAQKLIRSQGIETTLEDLEYKHVPLGRFQGKINQLFREMRRVEDDPDMSPKDKKERLDRLQRQANDYYKIEVDRVREAISEAKSQL